jgi:hypothetical protein
MNLTPALLRSIICNLWSVYGKTENDAKLQNAFISMTETLHPFWVMKHLVQHCDHHNWIYTVGISNDPKLYFDLFINETIHLYDKGFII